MKGVAPLFIGIFGTFAFSWAGSRRNSNAQIGHLDPQMDEEGNDPYPAPESGMVERGRQIYAANGCVYCHTQQVRAPYAGTDIDRKWGDRRSAPRDYIFERPAMLGRMRMGPDLANVGKRAPSDDENAPPPGSTQSTTGAQPPPAPAGATQAPGSATAAEAPAPGGSPAAAPAPAAGQASPAPVTTAPTANAAAAPSTTAITGQGGQNEPLQYSAGWHHRHLYNPRSITAASTMPAFRFLYEKRRVSGEPSAEAVKLSGHLAPPEGWEIVPTYDAKCLVAYLMSLDQSHALKEVKSATPPSPPAPGKAVK
jgi:cbb3-type cytochrome oxidase cytochrome c subunit